MKTIRSPAEAIAGFLDRLGGGCRLAVALSGGGDSTALAWLLREAEISGRLGGLLAITIDHGLRDGSAREAEQVAALCGRLGIAHASAAWDGPKPASGLQNAARLARYRLMREIAKRHAISVVATAHTLDDQIETVAMRSSRSSGRGLSGMAESTLYARDLWIVRPLLKVRRHDLRDVLERAGVGWIEDPSNLDRRFERVRVRSELAADFDESAVAAIDKRAALRRRHARDLAMFLETRVRVHAGPVAQLSLAGCGDDPHLPSALALVAAIMGGRNFLPPATVRDRLADFVRDPGNRRMTAAGCIFEILDNVLHIYRERRNLPELVVAPGETILWDGRFRVTNPHPDAVVVAGYAGADDAGIADKLSPAIPAGIARRAASTRPVCRRVGEPDEPADCVVVPAIALFDLFLPDFDWIVAQRCAELMGLPAYPAYPLEIAAKPVAGAG